MRADIPGAQAAATRLLLAQRLQNLFIHVSKLSYEQDITFDSMQHFCTSTRMTVAQFKESTDMRDGCTLIRQKGGATAYVVLYNEDCSPRRRSFTLAHEVAHICLKHHKDDPDQEEEANAFAAQLLLPEILVYELSKKADMTSLGAQLYDSFNVSRYVAEQCVRGLRTSILNPVFTPDDHVLLKKFSWLLPRPEGPVITV